DWHGPRTKSREDIWRRRSVKRVGAARSRGLARGAPQPRRERSSIRARRRRDRGSVVDADPAKARELHGGLAWSETCGQGKNVDLDALDPAELDAEEAPQRGFDTRAAVG